VRGHACVVLVGWSSDQAVSYSETRGTNTLHEDCLEGLVRRGSFVLVDASNLIDEKPAKDARQSTWNPDAGKHDEKRVDLGRECGGDLEGKRERERRIKKRTSGSLTRKPFFTIGVTERSCIYDRKPK